MDGNDRMPTNDRWIIERGVYWFRKAVKGTEQMSTLGIPSKVQTSHGEAWEIWVGACHYDRPVKGQVTVAVVWAVDEILTSE